MPRSSTVLQVFVASPSDVAEERTTLDSVIAELNRTWAGSLRIAFDVWKWETHARPGFSADAQAVINAQVPDDYDVFIGILWARLGTPTGRAISGTVEEFERAYARFKATGSVPEIMMYFKDAPLAPSKIDSDQFAALQTSGTRCPRRVAFTRLSKIRLGLKPHSARISQQLHKSLSVSRIVETHPQCEVIHRMSPSALMKTRTDCWTTSTSTIPGPRT